LQHAFNKVSTIASRGAAVEVLWDTSLTKTKIYGPELRARVMPADMAGAKSGFEICQSEHRNIVRWLGLLHCVESQIDNHGVTCGVGQQHAELLHMPWK